jgi:predicted extracellular nuclease
MHAKCCGFAGSKEDDLRVQQSQQIVDELKRMRQGEFGEAARNAPVILIGDYNLVGSRNPLDVLNAAGLRDTICRAPDGSAWDGETVVGCVV